MTLLLNPAGIGSRAMITIREALADAKAWCLVPAYIALATVVALGAVIRRPRRVPARLDAASTS